MNSTKLSSHEDSMNAAVLKNSAGAVCINFNDPAYVRAQCIYLDKDAHEVYALLDEHQFLIGEVSKLMAEGLAECEEVLLTGTLPEGQLLELYAPVIRN